LWLTDQIRPECALEPFVLPPEAEWTNIVAALRYIRDYVVPAIGPVTVSSGYRDPAFNDCIQGAPRSAHRGFHALDLVPADPHVTREPARRAGAAIRYRHGHLCAAALPYRRPRLSRLGRRLQ
jgi:hypothetical protein